ncbi:hypothetical protein [Rhizobium binxianense]
MKISANIECYKAGAKACGAGKGGATNPHPSESTQAKIWDAGYLDQQKRHAYQNRDLSRKRAKLHINRTH